jgi:glycosyltransferase involved in cell wall biosynthesis
MILSPKLSIITINRNNATGLRKTIESVVRQTSTDFEYIVIDGASTDDSVAIMQSFDYSTINSFQWISEPDAGIYNAMNKGIKRAKGEYCQFLNSGDCLVNTTVVEKMLSKLPDAPIVIGNMLKELPNGKIHQDKGSAVKGSISMLTFYRGTLNHSPAFIKRSLFDTYGLYDESLKIVADWKWFLIAVGLNNEAVSYRDIDVVLFDMNGISTINKDLDKQERRQVLEELLPTTILADYDKYGVFMTQIDRMNNYAIASKLFWFMDRFLFKIERYKA